jgi:hypothetical protein
MKYAPEFRGDVLDKLSIKSTRLLMQSTDLELLKVFCTRGPASSSGQLNSIY